MATVLYGSEDIRGVTDLHGRPIRLDGDGITVLAFIRSDCPIANRYAPELARIAKKTLRAGVRYFLVYVDPNQSLEAIRSHMREFESPFIPVFDRRHELVRYAKARTTPEVAVFKGRTLVYRGRIDNQYVDVSTSRREASIHDLDDVLTRMLAGEPLKYRSTRAVGCFIEDLR